MGNAWIQLSPSNCTSKSRLVLGLVPRIAVIWQGTVSLMCFDGARRECSRTLSELSLGSMHLPWALATLREDIAVWPEGADRDRESVCAKGVAAGTDRGAGSSATVRSRIACGWSTGGRQPGGRPSIDRMLPPELSTPRQRESAASEPSQRPRLLKTEKLRPHVVTEQNLFFTSLVRSARLPRTPRDLAPQPCTLLRPRLSSSRSQRL
jgi:hypothetical protein